MPKRRIKPSSVILEDGLLEVDFLCRQMPEHRERILKYEIERRTQNALLLKGSLRLMRWQIWDVVRSAFWTGLTVFFLFFALGQVGSFVRTVADLSDVLDRVPAPVAREIELDAYFDPSGTAWSFATGLPEVTILDATVIALVVMLLFLMVKGYLVAAHIRQVRRMKEILEVARREKLVLETWLAKSEEKD